MTAATPPQALRLTFALRGLDVELVASQLVGKELPPSDALELPDPVTGFFVELRSPDDVLTFRRIMHSPVRDSVEFFAEDGSIARQPVSEPEAVFTVLVPALRDAPRLVLRDNATRSADRSLRTLELGSFDLTPYLPK